MNQRNPLFMRDLSVFTARNLQWKTVSESVIVKILIAKKVSIDTFWS